MALLSMLPVMKYGEATKLIASLRYLKKHLAYFPSTDFNLPYIESNLDSMIDLIVRYRNYLKSSVYNEC